MITKRPLATVDSNVVSDAPFTALKIITCVSKDRSFICGSKCKNVFEPAV